MKKLKRRWWRLYQDRAGKYRVAARASNGRKVWASSQGYASTVNAVANAMVDGGAPCGLHNQPLGVELKYPQSRPTNAISFPFAYADESSIQKMSGAQTATAQTRITFRGSSNDH